MDNFIIGKANDIILPFVLCNNNLIVSLAFHEIFENLKFDETATEVVDRRIEAFLNKLQHFVEVVGKS